MDIERVLVSKIIATGQLDVAISKGVRVDHFADEACRDAYSFIIEHARQFKSPPSAEAFKTDNRGFELIHVQDPLEWVIEKFIEVVVHRKANMAVLELAKACDDPERVKNLPLEFLEVSRNLAIDVPSRQVARFSDMAERIDDYEKRKAEGLPTGVPFGYPTLDRWTGGIQPHEFVTVSAFSGGGKSTILQAMAFNAYVQGYTPLIISLEMEADAMLRRFDAMAAKLDYYKLKQLQLEDDALLNWRAKAASVRKHAADIPIIDSIRHCTPDHIFAETVRHKPDLVIVDYLSLLRSSSPSRGVSMWQSLTEITQDLKQNARTLKIPIVAAAQLNRKGKDDADLENMGYALSIVQDSDIVIGIQSSDELKEQNQAELKLNKNRDGRLGTIKIKMDYEEMDFGEVTLRDLGAMFKRKREEETASA